MLVGAAVLVGADVLVGAAVVVDLGTVEVVDDVGDASGTEVLVVVVGAPIVEESVYRGLLQGSFVRRFGKPVGVVVVAAWFALVHFRPIEYPGLFVFGLLLGLCAVRTGRLGLSIVTHFAFNAAGLITVARR